MSTTLMKLLEENNFIYKRQLSPTTVSVYDNELNIEAIVHFIFNENNEYEILKYEEVKDNPCVIS